VCDNTADTKITQLIFKKCREQIGEILGAAILPRYRYEGRRGDPAGRLYLNIVHCQGDLPDRPLCPLGTTIN
jgi:hypothetical protein